MLHCVIFFSRDTQFFLRNLADSVFSILSITILCSENKSRHDDQKFFFAVSTNQPRVFPRPLTLSQWGHNFSEVVLQIIFHKGVSDLETCFDYLALQEEVVKTWIFSPICLHTTYSWNIKWQKCAGAWGLNGFIFKKIKKY